MFAGVVRNPKHGRNPKYEGQAKPKKGAFVNPCPQNLASSANKHISSSENYRWMYMLSVARDNVSLSAHRTTQENDHIA